MTLFYQMVLKRAHDVESLPTKLDKENTMFQMANVIEK